MSKPIFPKGNIPVAADLALEAPFMPRRNADERHSIIQIGTQYIIGELSGPPVSLANMARGLATTSSEDILHTLVCGSWTHTANAQPFLAYERHADASEKILRRYTDRKPEVQPSIDITSPSELAILGLFNYGRAIGLFGSGDFLLPATSAQRSPGTVQYNLWGKVGSARLQIDTTHPNLPEGNVLGIKPTEVFPRLRTGRDMLSLLVTNNDSRLAPAAQKLREVIDEARRLKKPMTRAEIMRNIPGTSKHNRRVKSHFKSSK